MDRVKDAVSSHIDLSHLSKWIARNTRHPKDDRRRWSFADHEFQEEIINDSSQLVTVKKCSQVGISEVFVRLVLSLLAVKQNHTAIYTLPTGGFATKFAKSRMDPVIAVSPMLKGMVSSDNDSSSLKQFGSSFLHIAGTFTQSAAISTPADFLFTDEIDFSDQKVLTTYVARLGHAEGGGLHRQFSTPTVSGFGIEKAYSGSSKARYFVKCDSCHQKVAPDFFADVHVPGFDDDLIKIEKDDVTSGRLDIANTVLRCPNCRSVLTVENLADPDKRGWVHEFPDRIDHSGYWVVPFDVPRYNPPSSTILQLKDYARKADWVNFKVGSVYEDAESSIVREVLDRVFCIKPLRPRIGAAEGCVLGMDVGKICHLFIGKRVNPRRFEIVHVERIRQGGENEVESRVMDLVDYFGVVKGVIDAGPDFTIALSLINQAIHGVLFGNYYSRTPGTTLSNIRLNEAEQITTSYRTGTLDATVKEVNSGKVLFPVCPEQPLMIEHFGNIKRIVALDATGKETAYWVSTGPDHYAHALNYLMIADELNEKASSSTGFGVLPMAASVRMRTGEKTPRGHTYG